MPEAFKFLFSLFLHLDEYLSFAVSNYGNAAYLILFLVVFAETGLVLTPFLPGDSLLFAAGVLSASGIMNISTVFTLLSVAAIIGDSANYWIGETLGSKITNKKFIKKKHLTKTKKFYDKYGGLAIIIARFVPIIRTFAPFVAGLTKMNYKKFVTYNITGAFLWVSTFVLTGYFFGKLPIVQENFHLVVLAIIALSISPILIEKIKRSWPTQTKK